MSQTKPSSDPSPTHDRPTEDRKGEARDLMEVFLRDTGVTSDAAPRRYLWTDAFAVCNLLGQDRLDLARRLVDQVHHTLGRHRDDDPREGWISGLDEEEGRRHPTAGGLRIGKKLPEREPSEPFDQRKEWDRDGQYFHYLTKWMHTLVRVARETLGEAETTAGAETDRETYGRWAAELAKRAHQGFVYQPAEGGRKRMFWKMSIDLSRPQVPSMGQHDPLDGYVTYRTVRAPRTPEPDDAPSLALEVAEMAEMAGLERVESWATDDPLGLGGLLGDALRVARLIGELAEEIDDDEGGAQENDLRTLRHLLQNLLESAAAGISSFRRRGDLGHPAARRLAFRELGLSIGLHAADEIRRLSESTDLGDVETPLGAVLRHAPMAREIEDTWREPANRREPSWTDHGDINAVMLATSLAPDGYLRL